MSESPTRVALEDAGWSFVRSEDYCSSIADGTHATPKPVTEGYPLYTSKNLTASNRLDKSDFYKISERDLLEITRRSFVDRYDILFGMIGTVGNPVVVDEDDLRFAVKNVGIFRFGGDCYLSRWFYYCLNSSFVQEQFDRALDGSTQKFVSLGMLRSFYIQVPQDQRTVRRICDVLTTLDELIEKTEALIAKYQSVKQGMMHDLFTRGVDGHGHLRPTYSEAPELYKESELGWIPKEWEVERVGDHLERIEQGWSPDCDSEPATSGEWGVMKTTAVVWEGFNWQENKRLPKHLSPETQYEVHVDDVLMTRGGPNSRVGVVAIVRETRERLMLSDKIYRLVPRKSVLPRYLALALSSDRTQTHLSTLKTGLAESQTNISQAIVRRLWIGIPNKEEQEQSCQRIDAIDLVLQSQRKSLAAYRVQKTGLMQDLLTGKVRVKPDEGGDDV